MIELPESHGYEILRSEVGSTLHGTGLGVALEDHDEMGIFIERPRTTIGLHEIDHYECRTAEKNQKSKAGDTDLIVYSLRKWAKLAVKGNPSVLLLLYAPDEKLILNTPLGTNLRLNRKWFASLKAGRAFLGYMEKQRQRMVGQRGKAGRVRVTDDCSECQGRGNKAIVHSNGDTIERYDVCDKCFGTGKNVDWKYAMHLLRLGHQGVEYLTTGNITLPIPGEIGDDLRAVRKGEVAFDEVIKWAESLEATLKTLLDGLSPLPDNPRLTMIEQWVIDAHLLVWGK